MGIIEQFNTNAENALYNAILEEIGKNARLTTNDIAEKLQCDEQQVQSAIKKLHEDGYDILSDEDIGKMHYRMVKDPVIDQGHQNVGEWSGNPVKIGLISDTHLGIARKYSALDELEDAMSKLGDRGVEFILHAGDFTHGVSSRHAGLEFEMEPGVISADDQVDYVIEHFPVVSGVKTYFITGSHDLWVHKKVGFDVGRAIERARDDLEYLGPERAEIFIGPSDMTRITLHHPTGGEAYAVSYNIQKLIEKIPHYQKPHIYITGHYHTYGSFMYDNVMSIMLPGFQWSSPFYRRIGSTPEVGAVYLEIDLDESGSIISHKIELFSYYKESDLPRNRR